MALYASAISVIHDTIFDHEVIAAAKFLPAVGLLPVIHRKCAGKKKAIFSGFYEVIARIQSTLWHRTKKGRSPLKVVEPEAFWPPLQG